ncbi:MAG: IS110 family transposase [Candidatus Methylomirabilota bacterium]
MTSMRGNGERIKRFRELKADLRTRRDRLLVGIDVAKAAHVAQIRVAHTRILEAAVPLPNTTAGFTAFWRRLQRHQRATGVAEIVVALEPTGTYHQALAEFLDARGAAVVLVDNPVAALHRRLLDRTWAKSDPKDAHNLGDLLEQGRVLFCAMADEPVATLRRLVRLLRRARVERGACKARWQNTLRPALGPAAEPLPPPVVTALPAPLRAWLPAAERRGTPGRPRALAPGLVADLTDLATRVTAVHQRIAALEAALVAVTAPLPATAWLRSIPGLGPPRTAIVLAELGDIAWFTKVSQLRKLAGLDIIRVQSGQWAGTARISRCGRPLLRWAVYQAALGACRTPAWHAKRAILLAKRQGDPHAFFKTNVELAAKLLRVIWGVWRSGHPYHGPVAVARVA